MAPVERLVVGLGLGSFGCLGRFLTLGQTVLKFLLSLAEVLGELWKLRTTEQNKKQDNDEDDLGWFKESDHAEYYTSEHHK